MTNFEPSDDEDAVNKIYLDTMLSEANGHMSHIQKFFNEFELRNNPT